MSECVPLFALITITAALNGAALLLRTCLTFCSITSFALFNDSKSYSAFAVAKQR
jgi:hypothetical protein